MNFKKITRTDARLITPYLDIWNELITRIPPDTILTKSQLTDMIVSEVHADEGAYRTQFVGALIRWSLSRGDLTKIGTEHFVRIGVSRESVVALAQHVALGGLFVVEETPGTFYGYEDLQWADGTRERHFTMFARNIGDSMRWAMFSVPIKVPLGADDEPQWTERTRGFVLKRLETLMLM